MKASFFSVSAGGSLIVALVVRIVPFFLAFGFGIGVNAAEQTPATADCVAAWADACGIQLRLDVVEVRVVEST
jgi:hypothetical protein